MSSPAPKLTIRSLFAGLLILPGVTQADVLLVPEEYETIHEAVAAARNGDTVSIAPGPYDAHYVYFDLIIDKSLTLDGRNQPELRFWDT